LSDPTLLGDLLNELSDDAHDLLCRLEDVIGALEEPSEEYTIAQLARFDMKRTARWIDQLRARLDQGGTT
jgi:hypothetical protein